MPIVLVFLTAFLPQIPVIHTPTLRFEIKPQAFIRAMQACGAIFVKTPVAQAFVEKTLSTSRELIRDFVRVYLVLVAWSTFSLPLLQDKPSPDPKYKSYINITLLLLQTIGLFHQDPQQRAQSSVNHGIIVQVCNTSFMVLHGKFTVSQMVRQTRLIEQSKTWEHQVIPIRDPAALDTIWHEWAIHETIKRYLLVFSLKARDVNPNT